MAIDTFRTLLSRAGYHVVFRAGQWVDCYVSNASERWHGYGFSEDEAMEDISRQMMPSALGKHLLLACNLPENRPHLTSVALPAPTGPAVGAPPAMLAPSRDLALAEGPDSSEAVDRVMVLATSLFLSGAEVSHPPPSATAPSASAASATQPSLSAAPPSAAPPSAAPPSAAPPSAAPPSAAPPSAAPPSAAAFPAPSASVLPAPAAVTTLPVPSVGVPPAGSEAAAPAAPVAVVAPSVEAHPDAGLQGPGVVDLERPPTETEGPLDATAVSPAVEPSHDAPDTAEEAGPFAVGVDAPAAQPTLASDTTEVPQEPPGASESGSADSVATAPPDPSAPSSADAVAPPPTEGAPGGPPSEPPVESSERPVVHAEPVDAPSSEGDQAVEAAPSAPPVEVGSLSPDAPPAVEVLESTPPSGSSSPPSSGGAPEHTAGRRPASASRVASAGETMRGVSRSKNDDALAVIPAHGLFIVADGLDTHTAGDVAAALAVETVRKAFEAKTDAPSVKKHALPFLVAAIQRANAKVAGAGRREAKLRGMGATVAAALTIGSRVALVHIGDSRIYRLRNSVLELLTTDHSVANGQLRLSDPVVPQDPHAFRRSQLTRVLGTRPTIETDASVVPAQAGDVLLICTDGLHGVVGTEDIRTILMQHHDPKAAVEQLLARATAKGRPDNATAIVVRWE